MRAPLGVILAGGRGTRMGGRAKADVVLGGETLLERVIARLEPQVAALAVNSNAQIASNFAVITDTLHGHLGPLAGVLAGLEWAAQQDATHIVTAAVDTPFFPCDLVPHLLLAGDVHPHGFAIAATADGSHPTFGLWPVALRDSLAAFLDGGHRKMTAFTAAQTAALATFPETQPHSFFNINTPDDLNAAAAWL
ncbi:MAG: molybdenum cofactor guanylyltransferase MobA [Octadecabacter sp.]